MPDLFNCPPIPDNENTALYKVLQKADWLARAAGEDGIGYRQHSWDRPTVEENLRLVIDCSKAIWFVFTRAGCHIIGITATLRLPRWLATIPS